MIIWLSLFKRFLRDFIISWFYAVDSGVDFYIGKYDECYDKWELTRIINL